jgi:DNA-binding winged helix-turn-helix (wHTH) protein/tetratricopeptide (TPR) repeat protein
MLVFPPFRLDSAEERLWKGDKLLALRRKPFAILRYLAQHPKKLVSADELLTHVWGGAVVSDSSMRSHLHELRQVLGEGVIETVIGRGYRFIAELREEVAAPEPLAPSTFNIDPLVVGRDAELETLRRAFELVRAGRRQVCFVTGKPGIGKSTLVRTFLAALEPNSVLVARGGCFEQHGAPEPYLAIIEAVTALARSPRGDRALAVLVRYAPTFVAQIPHLVSDEQQSEVSRRAAGSSESRQLRELSEAFEAMCAQEPLVLVLEDLQWSDVATIDLLSRLGQREERAKLLVIATARHAELQSPEHPLNAVVRSLVARNGAISLQLPKFGVVSVQSFIDRRFPGHDFPAELTDLVAKITGGTPLFLASLLDELASRGMFAERDGHWTLSVSTDEVQAHRPASIKQLIDMQIDRLPPPAQRVLEAASIVGSEFSTELVAAALELSVEEVDEICDSLVRKSQFIHTEPDARYGVNHALVQEVCLERSSPARRQRWHRLVAEALERDPRGAEISHLLANHYDAAGDAERAVRTYATAAEQAARRYATSDTIALCARALALLPRIAPSRERDLLELQLLDTMCDQVSSNSFKATFAGREPLSVYSRAIELARSLNDSARVYAALTQLCVYHMITAQYARSTVLTLELEQIEESHALDPLVLHSGIFARAYIAFFSGDLSTAIRLFERLVPAEADESVFHANLPGRTLALAHLACARWVSGEPERALDEALAAIALSEQVKVPVLGALAHVVRARLRYLRRDPLPVVEEESLHAVRAAAADLGLLTEANAFALLAEAQRAPLALTAIEPLLNALRQRLSEVATCSTLIALVLIDVLRISGHDEQASRLSDEMIAFARGHDENVYLPELLRVRGEQRQSVDADAAAHDYREAIELARRMGARSFELRAGESLAAMPGAD